MVGCPFICLPRAYDKSGTCILASVCLKGELNLPDTDTCSAFHHCMLCSRSIRYHFPLRVDLQCLVIALILPLGAYRCHVGVHMWNITLGQYLRTTSIVVSLSFPL